MVDWGAARRPRIMYVCPNLYHLLTNKQESKGIGGAELQGLLVIRELVRRGYEVSAATFSYGQEEIQNDLPFRVIPTFKRGRGIPFFHRLFKMFVLLWALQRASSEIYYFNVKNPLLALVVISARLNRRKVVFRASSDVNLDIRFTGFGIPNALDRFFYLWGLRRCDFYVVQNRTQQELLKRNFRKEARIIYNGLPGKDCVSTFQGDILWVAGHFRAIKNPRMFLELARRVPRGQFVMVGGNPITRDVFSDAVAEEARSISNVRFTGFLSFDEVEALFARASLLVNTSDAEGFPNTFLQAWSRGIPVISARNINPDGLITKYNLGRVVSDVDEMAESVEAYLDGRLTFSPDAIKTFFDENLRIERTVEEFETLLVQNS